MTVKVVTESGSSCNALIAQYSLATDFEMPILVLFFHKRSAASAFSFGLKL